MGASLRFTVLRWCQRDGGGCGSVRRSIERLTGFSAKAGHARNHKRSKSNGTTSGFTIGSPFGIMFLFAQPSNGTGSSLSITKDVSARTAS